MLVSVILPTFNEAGHINLLISKILDIFSDRKINCEAIVIDDNSPDGTARVVSDKFNTDSRVKLIIRKNESGLASAIKRGIIESNGDIVVLMDTDFNHNPLDIIRMLHYSRYHEVVIGSRFIKGGDMVGAKVRWYGSFAFNYFASSFLGLNTWENQSGFLVIHKKLFRKIDLDEIFFGYGDYNLRLFYLLKNTQNKIKEVPVVYNERMSGESKTDFVGHLAQYIVAVFKLRFWW